MKLLVTNIGTEVKTSDIHEHFAGFGRVSSVRIATDLYSGSSLGYAFVVMPQLSEALMAVDCLDGTPFQGSVIRVQKTKEAPIEETPMFPDAFCCDLIRKAG